MKALNQHAALVIVDVQKGFDDPFWGPRNNPGAETHIAELLAAWRAAGRPVYHIQHMSIEEESPLRPDRPGNALKDEVAPRPGEPLVRKSANSAFIGTDLEAQLRARGLDTLVIVGLTTPHCISTTARMAGNLGFRTLVAADATAAFALTGHDGRQYTADEIHAVSLATLHDEFAEIVETSALIEAAGAS